MKKITKTVYVVEGREYENEGEAILAARARRMEALLDTLADANDLDGLHEWTASLSHILIRNANRLMAAINDPVPVEDGSEDEDEDEDA